MKDPGGTEAVVPITLQVSSWVARVIHLVESCLGMDI